MTGPFYGWIILLSFLWDGQCHHQCPAPKENGQRLAADGTGGWITAALRGGIPHGNGDGGGGPGLIGDANGRHTGKVYPQAIGFSLVVQHFDFTGVLARSDHMGNDKGIGPVGALGIGQQNLHAIFGEVIRIDRDPFIVRISYLKRHIHQNAIGIFFFQRGIAGKGFFPQRLADILHGGIAYCGKSSKTA